jgi:hypothetical protein
MKDKKIVLGLMIGLLALAILGVDSNLIMFGFATTLFSCFNTPARACEDCVADERNKVVHVAFVKRGTSISTSNSVTDILAAELAGTAYVIRNVSGAYDGGAATFGKGLGKQVQRKLAKKHTLTFIDFNYVSNVQYWADMEDQAANYDLYFFTDTQAWIQTNAYLSIEAKGTITDDNQTFIEASVSVTWSYKSNPINYSADVDSLSNCQQLFDGTAVSFSNLSGSTGTIIPSSTDEIDLVRNSSSLNAHLQTGFNLSSVSVIDGSLPAGLTLSYTGPYITLTGTATQAVGTYIVVIKGANSVGVAGQKTVKFVIS